MSKTTKTMWLRRVSQLGLAGALLMPLSLGGSEAAEQAEKNAKNVFSVKNESLKKIFDDVEAKRRAAIVKASDGDYAGALKVLDELLKQISIYGGSFVKEKTAEIENNAKRIKRVYSSEIMGKARDLAGKKDYKEAIEQARKAQILTPEDMYITNFMSECQKYIAAGNYKKEVTAGVDEASPKFNDNRKEIDMNLREAKLMVRKNQLEAAIPKLERVLLVDPFNMEALQVLTDIYKRLYKIGTDRGQEAVLITDARNSWEWSDSISRVAVSSGTDQQSKVRTGDNSELYNDLQSIIVEVPVGQSDVKTVIRYLNDEAEKSGKGISIISSNLSDKDVSRPVQLELKGVSLLDAIRYFSMQTGIPFQLKNKAVLFGQVDKMENKSFPVRSDIISHIIYENTEIPTGSTMKSGEGEGGGGDGAPEDDSEAPESIGRDDGGAVAEAEKLTTKKRKKAIINPERLKKYFKDRWVEFDEGSSIRYNPRSEQLKVYNTKENLLRIETLLRQLDALEQPMIMVELKMIELTNTNLNELGFEWAFSAKREKGNGWSIGTTDPTRHGIGDKDEGGSMFRVLNNLKIFPNFGEKIFGSDTKVDLSLSINAVAQNRQAEVLASPRILSENNPQVPAMIKMVENTYFITSWDQPDSETEGFNIKLDGDQPEWDGDARPLGVTFTVVPSVNVDNYTITLNGVKPSFYTHVRDHDNNLVYGVYQQTGNGPRVPIVQRSFNLKMPEFSRREIDTNITLYDGETVLIGGMVDNEVKTRQDKWPILGDIPFIGNFFRDQQHDIFNRTMLIFITARLMTPKGTPWNAENTMKNRGLVDFTR